MPWDCFLFLNLLKALENNNDFGYLFATMRSLCDVLAIKFELGAQTRKAYDAKDMNALKEVVGKYSNLLELLDVFYARFRAQWFIENKPNGFELHDIRLGGLIQRVKHCRDRLNSYIAGELTTLSELDEQLMDDSGNGTEFERKPKLYQCWAVNSVVDVF